ncbi:TfpX/TfpZ family type IV pilin accessory protein [Undibacterium sp. Xuan67W]|uniref:TfpX/TfpZ family type IV pilin accessory protein n=1 Tax=Undibacterium sp. Xuan67W TaxID=3413057 RepID=UPI003BF40A3F
MNVSRFRASGLHFLISFIVGFLLLALCWFVWYPAPMLMTIGGHEIFLLVVGIDVIVGPLLTLVVFKTGKKGMMFDLVIIAMLQIGAMTYGVGTLLEGRPVYLAALGNKFQVIQASELTDGNLAKAKMPLPWWGPRLVGTKAPTDKHDISMVDSMASVGGGRGHMPHLHIPYESMTAEILKNASSIEKLKQQNPTKGAEIDAWLKERGYSDTTAMYQPVRISTSMLAIIVDAKSAAVIGIANFNP